MAFSRFSSFLTILLLPAAALAGPVAEVVGVRGEAVSMVGSQATPLTIGTKLEEAAVIRTGSPGRVKLRFIDGSVIVVSDASSLKIEQYRVSEQEKRRDAGFVLDIGLISQTVAPAKGGSWSVRTPTAVTAVRGTEYMVEVRPDLGTEVSVQSGEVAVEPFSAPSPSGSRKRSLAPSHDAANVLLNGQNFGTTCNASGACEPSRVWKEERIQALKDRISGV